MYSVAMYVTSEFLENFACDIKDHNYLNGSDYRVVASYSGLHEECTVNISKYLA